MSDRIFWYVIGCTVVLAAMVFGSSLDWIAVGTR